MKINAHLKVLDPKVSTSVEYCIFFLFGNTAYSVKLNHLPKGKHQKKTKVNRTKGSLKTLCGCFQHIQFDLVQLDLIQLMEIKLE